MLQGGQNELLVAYRILKSHLLQGTQRRGRRRSWDESGDHRRPVLSEKHKKELSGGSRDATPGCVKHKSRRISRARLSEKHKKELFAGSRHDNPGCVKHKKGRISRARLSEKHKKETA